MTRIYILVKHTGEGYARDVELHENVLGAWSRKMDLTWYAKRNNISQQDAYVIVTISNSLKDIKFTVYDWQDQEVWRQPNH